PHAIPLITSPQNNRSVKLINSFNFKQFRFMKKLFPFVILVLLFLNLMFYSVNLYSQTQSVKTEKLTFDGKIGASEWTKAKAFIEFFKFIPLSENKKYESTIVYIKQKNDALYFAFDYFPKEKLFQNL
ncbi:MAG: hypothetical protein LH629_12790, partial [Ignavibacteria bacterium]|nr:hypothetical protein [Ignavibacteria bacterium]